VLRYTNGGGSSTEGLINHLKSKQRIHVIHEGEDHKAIPAQEEIRSQIMKKIGLFEATKKRLNNPEKMFHALITIKPKSAKISGTREDFLSHGTVCHKTQEQIEMMKVCFDCHASVI